MREDETGFIFFRGVFYRWAKLWSKKRRELREDGLLISGAPKLFCIGDLHIENFGTWRDREGRLAWGVNDFDEAYWMHYQNDLVRLAVSAFLALEQKESPARSLSREKICDALLLGYLEGLSTGGKPFIMAQNLPWLWKIATHPSREPEQFIAKLSQKVRAEKHLLSDEQTKAAEKALDAVAPKPRECCPGGPLFRRRAGVGSLGRPRLVRFFDALGGQVVREAKMIAPSAMVFVNGEKPVKNAYDKILKKAVRTPDPFFAVTGNWVARRLAFDCEKIALASLHSLSEANDFFEAMGFETANIHLGDKDAPEARMHLIAQNRKNPEWLLRCAEEMIKATKSDFQDYLETGFGLPDESR